MTKQNIFLQESYLMVMDALLLAIPGKLAKLSSELIIIHDPIHLIECTLEYPTTLIGFCMRNGPRHIE